MAATEHRAKKAKLQLGLREQRQDVDVEKVLQRLLETLICSLEREADAERRREDNIRRLRLPGCRSDRVTHILAI